MIKKNYSRKSDDVVERKRAELKVAWREPKKGNNDDSTSFAFYLHILALFIGSMLNSSTTQAACSTRIENRKFEFSENRTRAIYSHTRAARTASRCMIVRRRETAESNFRATAEPNFPLIPCRHVWKVKTFTVEMRATSKMKTKTFCQIIFACIWKRRVGCARFQK